MLYEVITPPFGHRVGILFDLGALAVGEGGGDAAGQGIAGRGFVVAVGVFIPVGVVDLYGYAGYQGGPDAEQGMFEGELLVGAVDLRATVVDHPRNRVQVVPVLIVEDRFETQGIGDLLGPFHRKEVNLAVAAAVTEGFAGALADILLELFLGQGAGQLQVGRRVGSYNFV